MTPSPGWPSAASSASRPAPVWGGDLPAAGIVILATVVCVATVAGWTGWSVLREPLWAWCALALAVAAGGSLLVRAGRAHVPRGGFAALLLALPASSVVAVTVVGVVRGAPRGLEWFLNGDHPRHVVYVADTWAQGSLTYAVDGYPRGWHSLLATLWTLSGAGLDAEHVLRLLELMGAASLLLSASLALALAHTGHALAGRLGLSSRASIVVGVVVSALSLLNVFLANYQALGYENSLLAALAVVVCCREVLLRAGTAVSLVVTASAVVVVAHAWQLLLPSVVLPALWCAGAAWRSGLGRRRLVAALLACATLVFAGSGVLAVVTGVGLDHAAEPGPDSPVPLVLLVMGLGASLLLGLASRDWPTRCIGAVTALPAATALALALSLGVGPLHYYPSKLLWQAALLSLPALGVAIAAAAVGAVGRIGVVLLFGRVLAVLGAVMSVYALALPWGAQVGAWSTVDGGRVVTALATPRAEEAVVVWLEGSPTTDSVTRILLDTFRVESTRARVPQARTTVGEECALLRTASRPLVLSTAEEEQVRSRYACNGSVTVEVLRVSPRTTGHR